MLRQQSVKNLGESSNVADESRWLCVILQATMSFSTAFFLSFLLLINCATIRNELRCGTHEDSDFSESILFSSHSATPKPIQSGFKKTNITWKISAYPIEESDDSETLRANVEVAATTAFQLWSSACNLNFFQTDYRTPDINLKFQRSKKHKRACSQDFELLEFAHYVKNSSNPHLIHINDDVEWTTSRSDSTDDSVNLVFLIAHEIGHVLGFRHNNLTDSIMFRNYYDYHSAATVELSSDDIAAARKRYGKRDPNVTAPGHTTTQVPRSIKGCSGNRARCQTSSDCCEWNTPDFKFIHSCGDDNRCGCVPPGVFCVKGYYCCDGSICNSKCPPTAAFHLCHTDYTPNCQSGLTCTVDDASLAIFPGRTEYGRCLPDPTRCSEWYFGSCQTSSDCCEWNTADYKMFQSCGDERLCECIYPGGSCGGGLRCCDGSICNAKCPPAAKFHYCRTDFWPNCQSGLTCTVDSVSLRIWPWHTETYGRCL